MFDNLVHESSLSYAALVADARPGLGDLAITSYKDGGVAPSSGTDDIAALQRTVDATVLTYGEGELSDAMRLFGGATISGALCDSGIGLDEATAANLSVGVGDEVTLWWPADASARPARVPVCGVLNPWHPEANLGARGYVVTSAALVESMAPGILSSMAGTITAYWFSAVPEASFTKAHVVESVIATNAGWTAFVWLVAFIGVGLWSFGAIRVWNGFRTSLSEPWRVLLGLGVRPALPPLFVLVVVTIMTVLASWASAVIARTFVLSWTSLYVTSQEIWFVAAILGLAALVVSASFVARYVARA
ncbi:MAG: hypothetical protein HYX55_07530 [Chloroflexi bacterium]|nr:hypothetical protein [Chloroflexota bacterium]